MFTPPDGNWIEALPDGHQGTWRTLEAMRYLVRKDYLQPNVRSAVQSICRAQSQLPPVVALFFFARDQIRFVEDPPNVEKVSDFLRTMAAREGDCDDKSVWLATALLAMDIPARFVVQSFGDEWSHVYLEFYDWSRWQWVPLDPAADGHTGFRGDLGWRQPLPSSGFEMRFSI